MESSVVGAWKIIDWPTRKKAYLASTSPWFGSVKEGFLHDPPDLLNVCTLVKSWKKKRKKKTFAKISSLLKDFIRATSQHIQKLIDN